MNTIALVRERNDIVVVHGSLSVVTELIILASDVSLASAKNIRSVLSFALRTSTTSSTNVSAVLEVCNETIVEFMAILLHFLIGFTIVCLLCSAVNFFSYSLSLLSHGLHCSCLGD